MALTRESFLVAFNSADSLNYFPSNNSSSFIHHLEHNIEYERYEVGLVSMTYSNHWIPEKRKPLKTPPKALSNTKQFFSEDKDDNLVRIKKPIQGPYPQSQFRKTEGEELASFFAEMHRSLKKSGSEIEVRIFLVTQDKKPYYGLEITDNSTSQNLYITLDDDLAALFGFEDKIFFSGKFVSKNEPNEKLWDSFPVGKVFVADYGQFEMEEKRIKEPSEYNINSLVEEIVTALDDVDCGFYVGENDNKPVLVAQVFTVGIVIQFSKKLLRILQLDPSHLFYKSYEEIAIPEALIKKEIGPDEKVELLVGRNILVHCNIVEPLFYSDKYAQLLRMFDSKASSSKVLTQSFDSVLYVGCIKSYVPGRVEITLTDETLNQLPISETPTSILLHFRKIF